MIYGVLILIIAIEGYLIMRLNRMIGSLKQDNEVLNTSLRIKDEQLKIMSEPNVDMLNLVNRMRNNEL